MSTRNPHDALSEGSEDDRKLLEAGEKAYARFLNGCEDTPDNFRKFTLYAMSLFVSYMRSSEDLSTSLTKAISDHLEFGARGIEN